MRCGTLVLCDPDEQYIQALGEFLGRGRLPMEVEIFTRLDKLKAYAQSGRTAMLLADESLAEELGDLQAGMIVILSRSAQNTRLQTETGAEYPVIGKYQAADKILARIAEFAGEDAVKRQPSGKTVSMTAEPPGRYEATRQRTWNTISRGSIRAVYSPVGRCGKTGFATVLGEILGEEKSTLYLNLEEYAALGEDGNETAEGTLTDLLYYAGQKDETLIFKLSGMVRTWKNLDYIRPAFSGSDLQAVDAQQWEYFLGRLSMESDYEEIILDVGAQITDLPGLLELCERIYVPTLPEPYAQEKVSRFIESLKTQNRFSLIGRMVRIHLPSVKYEEQSGLNPPGMARSAMGEFVRKLLKAEKRSRADAAGQGTEYV